MKDLKIAAALVAGFAAASLVNSTAALAAYGFCSAPHAPSTYLSKPGKPFCFSLRNCSEWDISSYKRNVDSYYEDLRRYVRRLMNTTRVPQSMSNA